MIIKKKQDNVLLAIEKNNCLKVWDGRMTDYKNLLDVAEKQLFEAQLELSRQMSINEELTKRMANYMILKEINVYSGTIVNLPTLLDTINDIVIGVLGVAVCAVIVNYQGDTHRYIRTVLDDRIVNNYINDENLKKVEEIFKDKNKINISDLSEENFLDIKKGSILAIPIKRDIKHYGYIVVYHTICDAFEGYKVELFQLIATQLAVFIENAYLFDEYERLMVTDGLTQVYNRICLSKTMEKISEQPENHLKTYSIIMLDIDHFKQVNDIYGHPIGDMVLKELAKILKDSLEGITKNIYRFGGEEFLILLEDKGLGEACVIAEKIRKTFREKHYPELPDNVHFTVSLGVSSYRASTLDFDLEKLIKLADDALYYAKKTGRNRIAANTIGLRLFLETENIIVKEIETAKRYESELSIFLMKCSVAQKESNCSKKEIFKLMNQLVENTIRKSDLYFCTEDLTYLLLCPGNIDVETIKLRMLEQYNVSELKDCDVDISFKEYKYSENGEDYVTKLGLFDENNELMDIVGQKN
ncbi:MAG: sensor domain-containing diguanylate cyclase [Bacillota bacterium]